MPKKVNDHLEHAVLPGDAHALVCEERDVHGADAALLPRSVDPRQVAEVGVSRARDQLAADLAEPEEETSDDCYTGYRIL